MLFVIFEFRKHFFMLLSFVVSLDNVMSSVNLIKKGILLTRNEYETHQHKVLKDFLDGTQDKVVKVISKKVVLILCTDNGHTTRHTAFQCGTKALECSLISFR